MNSRLDIAGRIPEPNKPDHAVHAELPLPIGVPRLPEAQLCPCSRRLRAAKTQELRSRARPLRFPGNRLAIGSAWSRNDDAIWS